MSLGESRLTNAIERRVASEQTVDISNTHLEDKGTASWTPYPMFILDRYKLILPSCPCDSGLR